VFCSRIEEDILTTFAKEQVQATGVSVRSGRWEFLDAARGIAALLVVFQHCLENNKAFSAFTSHYLNFGAIGVFAFFLVSGYIIPVSMERYHSVTKFWIGRAFRLLPAFWLSLAGMVAINCIEGPAQRAMALRLRFLFGNLIMMQELFRVPFAVGAYWTLTYEVFFYVLCTILLVFGVLRRSTVSAWAAASVFLAGNVASAVFLHRALSAEKLGLIVAAFIGTQLYRYSVGSCKLREIFISLAILAPATIMANWLRLRAFADAGVDIPRNPIAADMSVLVGYLFIAVLFSLRAREFPPVLVWLGKISYSVYLWHGIVLYCLLAAHLQVWLLTLLTFAITLLVGVLSYNFVEQPALAVQRKLFPHKSPAPPFRAAKAA
jgi:peptidoglycan/LPS O-acetylase OafA/YrhL